MAQGPGPGRLEAAKVQGRRPTANGHQMIKSMTGFASRTDEAEHATVGVTIRSVNHRYLDVQLRLPQTAAHLEPRLRALVQQRMARGRVEVSVSVQARQVPTVEVELNEGLVYAINAALERARDAHLVEGKLEVSDLLRLPQALTIRDRSMEPDSPEGAALERAIETAVERAVGDLDSMRVREGEHLRADLAGRRTMAARLLDRVAAAANRGREALEARVRERIGELPADLQGDPAAVAQEVVRLAARSDISEEVVRFRAHLAQWEALEASAEPCGRKLDFLLQEMNREVNTIGSKADGVPVPPLVIEMKAELEKMREQVQNVE
jgi:uncharacterized protein (TIGR00255 family)